MGTNLSADGLRSGVCGGRAGTISGSLKHETAWRWAHGVCCQCLQMPSVPARCLAGSQGLCLIIWGVLQERIKAALARADMKVWELFKVGNNNLPDAPLDISEKDGDMGKTLHQGLGPLVSVAV